MAAEPADSSENLADFITRHAAQAPDAVAIEESARRITYLELEQATWRAAIALRKRGLAPGDVVGLSMRSHAGHIVAVLALARIGAIQLPMSNSDPAERQQALLRRFRAVTLLSDPDADPAWFTGAAAGPDPSLRHPGGDAPWKVVTTSGTTGTPRAVLHTHAMALTWRGITQAGIPLLAPDRYLAVVELRFIAGILRCLDTLQAGGTVVLAGTPRTPDELLEQVIRHRASYLYLPSSWLGPLMSVAPSPGLRWPTVRILRSGSMVISDRLRSEARERLTPNLWVSYGTNEIGTPNAVAPPQMLAGDPRTVGAAAPGVELQVVDDQGVVLPPGETGNVSMRAANMPAGYVDDEEATAKAFRGGWFHPGDVGSLSAEGHLYYEGRSDERMNFTGIKFYPAEIESVLLQHPAIADAAAFPVSSDNYQDLPFAAVVLRPGATGEPDWKAWCAGRLGARAPWAVMVLERLPRNERGKVLRQELARLVRAQMVQARRR